MAATAVVTLAHRSSFAPPFVVLQQLRAIHQVGGQLGTGNITVKELGAGGRAGGGLSLKRRAATTITPYNLCRPLRHKYHTTPEYYYLPVRLRRQLARYYTPTLAFSWGRGARGGGEYAIPPSTEGYK